MSRPTVGTGLLAVALLFALCLPAQARCLHRRSAPPCPCPCPTPTKSVVGAPTLHRVYCCQGNTLVHKEDCYSLASAHQACQRCGNDRCVIFLGPADHQGEACAKFAPALVAVPCPCAPK